MRTFKQFVEAKFIDATVTRFQDGKPVGHTASYFNIPDEHIPEMKAHLQKIEALKKQIQELDPTGEKTEDLDRRRGVPDPKLRGALEELSRAFGEYNRFRSSIGATGTLHGHITGPEAQNLKHGDFV